MCYYRAPRRYFTTPTWVKSLSRPRVQTRNITGTDVVGISPLDSMGEITHQTE